jgi:hypothetical protein
MPKIAPNPYSPYADADPNYRHVFAFFAFFGDPAPGGLVPAACDAMAVVPEADLTETRPGADDLPDGLCPACVAVLNGGEPPKRPTTDCRECEAKTGHDGLCAVCRQEAHEKWWPTCDEQPAEEQPTACGKCQTPFDPDDQRYIGPARYRDTPYCRGCISRCQDTEIADHRCAICA